MREIDFMRMVWEDWDSRGGCIECTECGLGLPVFHPIHIAHVYGKGTEGIMRLDQENVVPMCANCHNWFDKDLRVVMTCYYKIKPLMAYLKHKYYIAGIEVE